MYMYKYRDACWNRETPKVPSSDNSAPSGLVSQGSTSKALPWSGQPSKINVLSSEETKKHHLP